MSNAIRPIPRLMSPRLPVGRRWLRFCRSQFSGHLRASARGAFVSLSLACAVVMFYVGINTAAVVFTGVGGTL